MDVLDKTKIVVICGPTASGKSGLAIQVSKQIRAEMVSADSMQIYKGLTIGTAAVTTKEADGVKQHLSGFLPPEDSFSVADYAKKAAQVVSEITSRKNNIVFCGGTGLYISSLVNGIDFTEEKPSNSRRSHLELQWEAHGGEYMLHQLAMVDEEYANKLHVNDKKRILRGLEQWEITGLCQKARIILSRQKETPFHSLLIGLDYPDRQDLYAKINQRVDRMLEEGLLAEAETVYKNREYYKTAAQAIGYKEFFPYFSSDKYLEECVEKLKQATRNYAKRQLTWFRRMPTVQWLDATSPNLEKEAVALAASFLLK